MAKPSRFFPFCLVAGTRQMYSESMKTRSLLIVALAVLAIATASGQTPTPTPECTRCDLSPPFPNCTPMPPDRTELFGTAQDNSPLYWDVYIPQPPDPAGPWPVVVIIHGGGFSQGTRCQGLLPCI